MWTLLIIITAIASAYAVELSETEAEEVVETFLLRVTDERFDHRIHKGHAYPSSDDCLLSFRHGTKDIIEAIRVELVVVPD